MNDHQLTWTWVHTYDYFQTPENEEKAEEVKKERKSILRKSIHNDSVMDAEDLNLPRRWMILLTTSSSVLLSESTILRSENHHKLVHHHSQLILHDSHAAVARILDLQ